MPTGTGKLMRYAGAARRVVRSGTFGPTVKAVARKVASTTRSYGLRRDLHAPHETPAAKIPITVRPLVDRDAEHILDLHADVDGAERWERQKRVGLLERGIGRPFVAVDEHDDPCYVQWLFGADENDAVADFFHGLFPTLRDDEALLEGAFTPARHQGQRIMSAGMSMIAERAADLGARYVMTFVGEDNVASLKGCERAGFVPFVDRRETRQLGRLRVDFAEMDPARVEETRVLR